MTRHRTLKHWTRENIGICMTRDIQPPGNWIPHALLRHGALLAKIGFALVDEEHRIGLAVVAGKIQFLEPRRAIKIAGPLQAAADVAVGRRGRLFLHSRHVGLHGFHLGGEGFQHLHHIGDGGIAHGCWWRCGNGRRLRRWWRARLVVSSRGRPGGAGGRGSS
jgi:hypothetical protein